MEHYRLAKCRKAYPLPKLRKMGIPQPPQEVEMLQTGLQWEDFEVCNACLLGPPHLIRGSPLR